MSDVCLSFTKLYFSHDDSFSGKWPTSGVQKAFVAHQAYILPS